MNRNSMPWFYGWNIVGAGITVQAVVVGLAFYSFTMWANEWAKEFGAPLREVMLITIGMAVMVGLLSPFVGRAMDRRSIRGLICLGAGSFSLGLVVVSQATAIWQIVLVYTTLTSLGLVLGGHIPSQTLAAKWFRARRSFAIGLTTIGTSIGGFLLPPVVTYLFLTYGWRTAHLILAVAVLLVLLPLVWTVVRNRPEDLGIEPEADVKTNPDGSAPTVFPKWSTRSILRERNFWATVLGFIPVMAVFGGIQANFNPYVSDLGIGAQDASYLVSLVAGSMVGGKVAFAKLADSRDHRLLYGIAVFLLAATMALMLTQPSYTGLIGISILFGFAGAAALPLLGAIISSRFGPDAFGQVMGLLGPFLMISGFGPYLPAAIRDSTGSYDLALLTLLIVLIPASCAIAFLKPIPGSASKLAAAT